MIPTYVLVVVVVAAALAGAWWAWRRRDWGLVVHVSVAGVRALVILGLSSPWVGGKAFAIASPAFLALALAACGAGFSFGRFVEASVVAGAIAAGVLWSNALEYHHVWLAPRGQLHELEAVGKEFAGAGPALMTTSALRGAALPAQARRRGRLRAAPALRLPTRRQDLDKGGAADIDRFRLDQVLVYRTLVLRRGPAASRPPSAYTLAWSGRYYEVWCGR